MSKKRDYINMNTRSSSKLLKIPKSTDPVLYDDKVTIINITMNEGEDDIVYNDVMNVEEFLEEHNIRKKSYVVIMALSLEWISLRSLLLRTSSPR